jgi:uncharacterized protein (TIGR02145 family)
MMKIVNHGMKNLFQFLLKKIPVVLLLIVFITSCSKAPNLQLSLPSYDSIVDIDNNSYKVVKIGNQWWMAENLRVRTYNDGTPITNATSDDLWKSSTGAFCLYKSDERSPGLLYNWFAVTDSRRIAPQGWHVATEADWQQLEKYLGMSDAELNTIGWRGNYVANKLKAHGKTNWLADEEFWPTNESGFNAKAGSCRKQDGRWGEPGLSQTGFWWTASSANSKEAYYRYMDYRNNHVFRHSDFYQCGYSVRCVKD